MNKKSDSWKNFEHRIACSNDIPKIQELMELSIRQLLGPLLTTNQLEASFDSMGLDDQLIQDGTYFMAFKGDFLTITTSKDESEEYYGYKTIMNYKK